MEENEDMVDISTLKDFNLSPSWEKQKECRYPKINDSVAKKNKKSYNSKTRHKQVHRESISNKFFYTVLPTQEIIQEIKQKIKQTSIAYSLKEIADVITEKKERLAIKIVCRDKNKDLWQSKKTKEVFSNKEQAVQHLLCLTENKIIESVIESEELPKGNFTYVLQCPITKKILPPTNFHDFNQIVEHHLHEYRLKLQTKNFITKLTRVDDEEQINDWSKQIIKRYSYKFLDTTSIGIYSFEKIRSLVEENFEKYFVNINQIVLKSKNLHLLPESINKEILDLLSNKNRWRKDFFIACLISFKKNPFFTFRKDEIFYVRYNARKSAAEMNANKLVNEIFKVISENKNINKKAVIEILKTDAVTTKSIILEIKWLAKSGYINEYSTGSLELN